MKFIYKKTIVKFFIKLLLVSHFLINNAISSEIGVIGFVIGNAFNQDGKKLNVGDPIFFGDTIKTDEGGKSQIMFVDQTVMTIGSNTELVVDEFVYDPQNTDGKLLSTIKSGSVKILTGKISEKNPENLVVNTPAGTIGTRGTEFKAAIDPETSKSQILLIGPGPKNSLGLRPGAVEVANESGSVLLDKPYLFTEVSQNTAPRQPVIIPQSELKKFQELEIEDDQPVTENNEEGESETQLAENEEQLTNEDDEISQIIKAEIFEEGEGLGDLVLETMVAALSKDDGGITAQMLGKSFINSGQTIPRELIPDDVKAQLPEGVDLNSPEADEFFANELQNEIEKVMLVSARIEDVAFIPTEFDQFNAGLGDIKVPIINDETGDVVFLDMGDINFQPQFIGLPGDENLNQPVLPEQLTLKGQEGIGINLGSGKFFEQQIDPQMEALNQRFEEALASGANTQELDQLILEMDKVMFEANQAAQAFEVAALQSQIAGDFKIDVLSNEEFIQTRESFVFNSEDYSKNWIEADSQGLVPVFDLDGSVNYLKEEDALLAQSRIDLIESGANEIISESKEEITFKESLNEYLDLRFGEIIIPEFAIDIETNSYAIGTTTYSDLNDKTSGTDTYTGTAQSLYVDQDNTGVANVGDVAGSFTPKHIIDYSNRTVTQQISNGTVSIGNISNQAFSIDKEHTYTSSTTGNVTPSFVVRKGTSGSKRLDDSLTGDHTSTLPTTGYTDDTDGNVYITLESEFKNRSGQSFADTVETTITIQTRADDGSVNQVSGTSSDGRD